MLITKWEHSGVSIELDDARLILDPGSFAGPLPAGAPIAATVITHEHPDHWTPERVAEIVAAAPDAPIYTTPATAAQLRLAEPNARMFPVAHGDERAPGPFRLSFHGVQHALIHRSIPVVENVGVFVNETLFSGGDSLEVPLLGGAGTPPRIPLLGVPIGSLWSNVGDVIDYVHAVRPLRAFCTHDAMLSEAGRALFTARVSEALAAVGGALLPLPRGEAVPVP
ncbi:MBL fold metallo-hydrolase [Leucobacter sp. M11]|uniref:MBL fold metallo-hydrolase n=1 Tax=Leucobacter sp. M11 TaxID=2993565 RepID=UPI002D7E8C17|nr:MBL fold metallo-hydrolase [Leucobacter sp. M11]MEB4613297.1 MBL fold metallo-hydrolase [Leucobacter sp. M11]